MKRRFNFTHYLLNIIDDSFSSIINKFDLKETFRTRSKRQNDFQTLVEYENIEKKIIIMFDSKGFNILFFVEFKSLQIYSNFVQKLSLSIDKYMRIDVLEVLYLSNRNIYDSFMKYSSDEKYTDIFKRQIEIISLYLLDSELIE